MKRCINEEQLNRLTPTQIGRFTSMFGGYTIVDKYVPNNQIYMDERKYGYTATDICELFNIGNMIEFLRMKFPKVDIRCEVISTVVVFDSVVYGSDYYYAREDR